MQINFRLRLWSRWHLCVVILHLFTKFYANVFIQYVDSTKFSVAAARHLGFVAESRGTTHEGPMDHSWWLSSVNNIWS